MAILDFPVNITRKTVAVSERGFGTILVLTDEKEIDYTVVTNEDLNKYIDSPKAHSLLSRLFMQKPQPQNVVIVGTSEGGIADAIPKLIEEGKSDFFFITSVANDTETIKTISETAQTANKVYAVTVNDLEVAKGLGEEVFDNTFVYYHPDPDAYLAEAMAVIMSFDIGGKTAKFKQVQGVKNTYISNTDIAELHKLNIQSYVEKMGVLQTTEGKMLSGEYIDVVLGEYWIRFRLEEALQRLAITEKKIPYTDRGIAMLVGEVEKVLSRAVDQGIVEGGQYKIDYRKRKDVPVNDVALRKYDYIVWTAMLQGAIHQGQISGVVTYEMVNEVEEAR